MYITKYIDNTKYAQGSVTSFAVYMEKEALLQESLDQNSARQLSSYLDKQNDVVRQEGREYFFNDSEQRFDSEDVTKAIDSNVKGLKKKEARYYTFSISPSAQEIDHLRRTAIDTRDALVEAGEVLPKDFIEEQIRMNLKSYAVQCMDSYAENFGNEHVRSNRDLLWFGMVEKDRYWKARDKEVWQNSVIDQKIEKLKMKPPSAEIDKQIRQLERKYIRENQIRRGGSSEILRPMMPKAGDNWHIHICVSRRDRTNSFNLSPNANSRNSKKHVLNGKSVRVGFNRERQKINCEKLFDRLFSYRRLATESYETAKQLRKQGGYAFLGQQEKDRQTRREESAEYARVQAKGYNDYYEALLQQEKLSYRQLRLMKRHLVGQLRRIDPSLDVHKYMNCTLDELQQEVGRHVTTQDSAAFGNITDNIERTSADMSDKILVSGLQNYHPITTVHKALRRGISMNKAIDRRRETFDRWYKIYQEKWYGDNFQPDNIGRRHNMDTLVYQYEHLEDKLHQSVLLVNAEASLAAQEKRFVAACLAETWEGWEMDVTTQYAREFFGADGAAIKTSEQFRQLATERLLPVEAQTRIAELTQRCEKPQTIEQLRAMVKQLRPEYVQKIETFIQTQGTHIHALKAILDDKEMSTLEKENAIFRLTQENPALNKAVHDFRGGIIRVLELHPEFPCDNQDELLNELAASLQDVAKMRQDEFCSLVETFISKELPKYEIIIEKQSQLEQLLTEITPDKEQCAERILDANNRIADLISPQAEAVFEQYGKNLFGADAVIRNEMQFNEYVKEHFPKAQARTYKDSLEKIFARIEGKRAAIIREYVKRTITSEDLVKVRYRQAYINRFINRQYSTIEAVKKKESLQQTVEAACHRNVLPTPDYRIFDIAAQHKVSTQAMVKAREISIVSPQTIAIKAAVNIIKILTTGY